MFFVFISHKNSVYYLVAKYKVLFLSVPHTRGIQLRLTQLWRDLFTKCVSPETGRTTLTSAGGPDSMVRQMRRRLLAGTPHIIGCAKSSFNTH